MKRIFQYALILCTILMVFLSRDKQQKGVVEQFGKQNQDQLSTAFKKAGFFVYDFHFEMMDDNSENFCFSMDKDIYPSMILLLSFASTSCFFICCRQMWSNKYLEHNKRLSEKAIPKYLLFHSFKLF